jgi:hypothetical protein
MLDDCDFPKGLPEDPKYKQRIEDMYADIFSIYDQRGIDITKKTRPDLYYFRGHAIIGHVDLVDIVTNSRSPFAQKGCYHWIFENQTWIKPVTNVAGKLSIWRYDL